MRIRSWRLFRRVRIGVECDALDMHLRHGQAPNGKATNEQRQNGMCMGGRGSSVFPSTGRVLGYIILQVSLSLSHCNS